MENVTLTEKIKVLEKENNLLRSQFTKIDERLRVIEQDKTLNDYQFKQIMDILESLQKDINELKEKPAKRWDLIITGIITAIISFIMAIILNK